MSQFTLKPRGYEQTAIVQSRGAVIAEVYTDREPGDQHDIARLFAAAPDLLAALQDITERYERLLVETRLTKRAEKEMKEILPFYTDQARAAIAKATGA